MWSCNYFFTVSGNLSSGCGRLLMWKSKHAEIRCFALCFSKAKLAASSNGFYNSDKILTNYLGGGLQRHDVWDLPLHLMEYTHFSLHLQREFNYIYSRHHDELWRHSVHEDSVARGVHHHCGGHFTAISDSPTQWPSVRHHFFQNQRSTGTHAGRRTHSIRRQPGQW